MSAGVSASAAGVQALADLVSAGGVVVLSGAGLSTESGIPDYRGPDGTRRVTPMEYGEFVHSGEARRRYWARSYVGWRRLGSALPNAGHRILADWEAARLVAGIITQNVDGLHDRAGSRSVIDLHGRLRDVVCLDCGDRSSRVQLDERMSADNPSFAATPIDAVSIRPDGDMALAELDVATFRVPRCLACGGDRLKPDVVFFGESVPKERVAAAYEWVDTASSLVVLGSSLRVMSGYRFVRRAAQLSIPIAILTHGPTRGDEQATLRLDAALGPTLSRVGAQILRSTAVTLPRIVASSPSIGS